MKQGQTLLDFNNELKNLTPDDRKELAKEFQKIGYEITDVSI